MTRAAYKAFSQGYRKAKRLGRYCYTENPYPAHSAEWYAFCDGWNTQRGLTR